MNDQNKDNLTAAGSAVEEVPLSVLNAGWSALSKQGVDPETVEMLPIYQAMHTTLSAHQSATDRVSAGSYQQEYLDLLADVLEAKEAMREAGVKQADFPTMFAEFYALLASHGRGEV